MLPRDQAVGFSPGGAPGAVIEKGDFGHAMNHRNAIRLLLVSVPCFHDPRVNGAEISLTESREVGIVLAQNFHHASPVIAMLDQGDKLQAVDHASSMREWFPEERLRCGGGMSCGNAEKAESIAAHELENGFGGKTKGKEEAPGIAGKIKGEMAGAGGDHAGKGEVLQEHAEFCIVSGLDGGAAHLRG